MCWREKQIPISFRTPSLTQLIPEAPERPGVGGWGGSCPPWTLPSSVYFLVLRLSMNLKALVEGKRGGKDKAWDVPSLGALFCNTFTLAKMKNSFQASTCLPCSLSSGRLLDPSKGHEGSSLSKPVPSREVA